MIYVADLGRWLNIREDANVCGLLWSVKDTRPYAIERAYHALGSGVVSRTSSPGDTSYTYYFISPRTAAGQFGEEIDLTRQNVVEFYDRRDALMVDNHIYHSSWWTDERFEVLETDRVKMPIGSVLDRDEYPILGYVYNKNTGQWRPSVRVARMLHDRKMKNVTAEPAIAFVEVDA